MNERPRGAQGAPGAPHGPGAPFDHEIDVRAIAKSAIWLAVVTAVSFGIAWFFYKGLARGEERLDPRPPALAAARRPVVPPGPRLQKSPESDLTAFRARESAELGGWAWVDREREIARVPVERAIEAVAASGRLPDFSGAVSEEVPEEVRTEAPADAPAEVPAP